MAATALHSQHLSSVYSSQTTEAGPEDQVDAVVLFTGSMARLEQSLKFSQTAAQKNPNLKFHYSGRGKDHVNEKIYNLIMKANAVLSADKISIDDAQNTDENAIFTRDWLLENPDVNNIVIVTADLHKARAQQAIARIFENFPRTISIRFHTVEEKNILARLTEQLKIIWREHVPASEPVAATAPVPVL